MITLEIVGILHVEPDAERWDFSVEKLDASARFGGRVLDGQRIGIPVNAPRNTELFSLRPEIIRAAVDSLRKTAADDDEIWGMIGDLKEFSLMLGNVDTFNTFLLSISKHLFRISFEYDDHRRKWSRIIATSEFQPSAQKFNFAIRQTPIVKPFCVCPCR